MEAQQQPERNLEGDTREEEDDTYDQDLLTAFDTEGKTYQ